MLDYKLKIGLVPERRYLADAKTRKVFGDYTEELREFCKYIPGLEFDPVEE